MSTTASSAPAMRSAAGSGDNAPGRPPRRAPAGDARATGPRASRYATTLFQVPFTSAMRDSDIALLARSLDLMTHMHPKLHDSPTTPGVSRLDFDSGLFLERGSADGQWVLDGRTWGHPSPRVVHEWHLRAAAAAHRLDPSVSVPARLTSGGPGFTAGSEPLPLPDASLQATRPRDGLVLRCGSRFPARAAAGGDAFDRGTGE